MKSYDDVRDYGAKGDGKTDDTQAIQNAINANRAFFPPGTYYLKQSFWQWMHSFWYQLKQTLTRWINVF